MNVEISEFLKPMILLAVLLNPFVMSIYLLDLIESLDRRTFSLTLMRGAAIATTVFCVFAVGGDAIFSDLFQVRFASFLVFGGILFLMVALRFVHHGPSTLAQLRGEPEHIAGSIAMPFMVGPGTVSASVLAGGSLPVAWAIGAILLAMIGTVVSLIVVKSMYEHVKQRNAALVARYIDVVGRASALLIGTIAIDMILSGIEVWWAGWNPT